MLVSASGIYFSSAAQRLYPSYISQHINHLSPLEVHWGPGSKLVVKPKLRSVSNHSMVAAGDKYTSYFAKSPGQSDSTRTASTDKVCQSSRSGP